MIYNSFQDMSISALALGAMRLPTVNGDNGSIDEEATAAMVEYAIRNGVNYFDTAWGYHNGQSEPVLGKILHRYPRDSFLLASKFPGYDLSNIDKVKTIFPQQLQRCQVEYFDFYLFHNVCEMNVEQYLDEKYEILSYLLEQKREGRIRHLGFSAHGEMPVLRRFLEAYGEHMEFCQLQINYLDWSFQQAKEKVELLAEYNIPVWVMEPVRGGKLTNLSEEHLRRLRQLRPEESAAAWAFRFIQSLPQVVVTLSGMSNASQLEENIRTFSENKPLNEHEMTVLLEIAQEMIYPNALPCTACRYCTTHCPKQLDIPALLHLYNEHHISGGGFIAPMALEAMPKEKWPSACVACRRCEAVCPQGIKVADVMCSFSQAIG